MIGESSNQNIFYEIENDSLSFSYHDGRQSQSFLIMKGRNLMGLSFAVDLYARDERVPEDFCRRNSRNDLRGLIVGCFGKAIVREATQEEMAKIQQYRAKQKGRHFKEKIFFYEDKLHTMKFIAFL